MILCLDVGNSQIYGGVFAHNSILLRFRYSSKIAYSSDQYGIFLKSVLRENNISHEDINMISICSVVPNIDYSLRAACIKYFNISPFMLNDSVKTGLTIAYNNPIELGADRLANAIAAVNKFYNQNIIIVDFGTATTICVINKNKEYMGGMIFPGIGLSMSSLQSNTAKLSVVEIVNPESLIGSNTTECIQSGLFYSQLATIKYSTNKIKEEYFNGEDIVVIGTGGFATLFKEYELFNIILPDLVLYGLKHAFEINNNGISNESKT